MHVAVPAARIAGTDARRIRIALEFALGHVLAVDLTWNRDTERVGTMEYSVDPRRADVFDEAVRRYWPALPDHGLPGLVQLFGIESPGLTASPAIATAVLRALAVA